MTVDGFLVALDTRRTAAWLLGTGLVGSVGMAFSDWRGCIVCVHFIAPLDHKARLFFFFCVCVYVGLGSYCDVVVLLLVVVCVSFHYKP